jgi:ABC-type bacteriocin/lantibiotic exporter with double-glycine peptidase domain
MSNRRKRALFSLLAMTVPIAFVAAARPELANLQDRTLARSIRAWFRGAQFAGIEGVVMQQHQNDCGAACLKMVLAAHGIESEMSVLYRELRTSERGTSLLDLRLVSARAGLPARSWVLGIGEMRDVPFPAIAFVKGNHFVVVKRLLDSEVLEVDDPALGKLRWPASSFCKVWSGEVLVFDPGWAPA